MRNLEMYVRIGSESKGVKRTKEESTLRQTSILLLPALVLLTVIHDPHRLNDDAKATAEEDHRVVVVLGTEVLILNLHIGQLVREDVAVQTANLVVRNLALVFKRVNAHVVLVVDTNMRVLAVT